MERKGAILKEKKGTNGCLRKFKFMGSSGQTILHGWRQLKVSCCTWRTEKHDRLELPKWDHICHLKITVQGELVLVVASVVTPIAFSLNLSDSACSSECLQLMYCNSSVQQTNNIFMASGAKGPFSSASSLSKVDLQTAIN
ncbi:unnamed protein product [Rhodiola kirilowii]